MPLKFKLVFTKSRTLKWLACLVVLAVTLRIPVLMVNRIAWRTHPVTNKTSPYLAIVNKDYWYKIGDILNRVFVINVTYVTMVACVLILSFKLYQSSKARHSLSVKTPQSTGQSSDTPGAPTLTSRDLQVIKSVTLICTIFVVAQLPYVVSALVRLLSPENDGRVLLLLMFISINGTCSYLNASVNIFVYYNYNAKYRSMFRSLLWAPVDNVKKNYTEKPQH
ncbi:chemosensory receptor A [Elysia marginata]|uniref:Chemosensory receptor A n=1 Tax=Elysia marginata TaxID=1093978 RepID=A0AAV4F973_9GAST|nr:chemosensory receptor A [Elysia marginata]